MAAVSLQFRRFLGTMRRGLFQSGWCWRGFAAATASSVEECLGLAEGSLPVVFLDDSSGFSAAFAARFLRGLGLLAQVVSMPATIAESSANSSD